MRRRAFSLIELLVVIAIIALLIALVLPSLGRAKETANRAVCASNQRQVSVATALYADDHKQVFPDYPYATLQLVPYVRSQDAFHCPSSAGKPDVTWDSDPNAPLGGRYVAFGPSCFGYNCHLQGGAGDKFRWFNYTGSRVRVHDVPKPSRTFWTVDATRFRFDLYFYGFLSGYRHGGDVNFIDWINKPGAAGFNAAMVDGHAEWVPWPVWTKWLLNWNTDPKFYMF